MPVITEYQPFKRIDPDTPYLHAIHYLVPMVAGGGKWTNYVHSLQPSAVIQMMHDSIDCRLVSDPEGLQVDFDKIAQKIKILTSTPPPAGLAIYKFVSAVPVDFWHRLLDIYAVGDGLLSSGWPDLEIADGNEVHCVEVKTTDRVSAHQANTMQILVRLGITCRVFRLINTSTSPKPGPPGLPFLPASKDSQRDHLPPEVSD
ncbi:hypothetical protein [Pseudomonas costantinii]|uniref:hypothetical protein n=1 Tax=Pseudomonas costantinii TaxID=168469 RepID=UPI0015A3A000|nr:hypothetical protein [Pseudomonas costantinii]NVZ71801.1 hypothetical protein [Pseudomonas costantinii]